MYPTTFLEWFHEGAWHRIGWIASTPRSTAALHVHAERLATAKPGDYRLIQPSIFADSPPKIVREWARWTA